MLLLFQVGTSRPQLNEALRSGSRRSAHPGASVVPRLALVTGHRALVSFMSVDSRLRLANNSDYDPRPLSLALMESKPMKKLERVLGDTIL